MKKIVFLLLLGIIPISASSQCKGVLSKNGTAHWKAAKALEAMSTTVEDQEQIADEYKKVIETDPNYAPVYMTLGKLYTKLGNRKGDDAFDKAEFYYNKCKTVCADSADAVYVELAILEALRKKYANGPIRYVGKWGIWSSYIKEYSPMVEISYSNNKFIFNPIGDGKIVEKKESETRIEYVVERIYDKRDELRKKGWTHFYDDCDNNADPGYPTTGTYKYDRDISRVTFTFFIENNNVFRKVLRFHSDYYFKGQKTYAETEDVNWKMDTLVKCYPPRKIGDRGRVAEEVDLGLSVKWASWNVGASRPEEFGAYFAWGEIAEKDVYDINNYTHCDGTKETIHDIGLNICGTQYDAANIWWGNGWRMPTIDEMDELIEKCTREKTVMNGIPGWKFTGPNGNSIFIPCAGEGDFTASRKFGLARGIGEWICYWSGTGISDSRFQGCAEGMGRDERFVPFGNCLYMSSGHSIRPVK